MPPPTPLEQSKMTTSFFSVCCLVCYLSDHNLMAAHTVHSHFLRKKLSARSLNYLKETIEMMSLIKYMVIICIHVE